jgi:uncharacterized metal-binding protein YceD (DUF177 family)
MKPMEKAGSLWSLQIALEDIPEDGLHMEAAAPDDVRAELAKLAGVRDVPLLAAVFDLTRQGEGVHVGGQVSARVGQTCVVSLEPVENAVEEPVDLLFAPEGKAPAKAGEEPPEPLIGGKVNLGAVATEFFLLGIDPYPRKEGAEFNPPATPERGEHPFAALATLKKRLGGGQS